MFKFATGVVLGAVVVASTPVFQHFAEGVRIGFNNAKADIETARSTTPLFGSN